MKKLLHEEITRIKSLMFESASDFQTFFHGEIESPDGMKITFKTNDGEDIGKVNIIGFKHAVDLSRDLRTFLENKNDLFKDGNSVYTYGTEVYDKFKRMGYGTKLKEKCHELAKNNNYNYVMSIVSKDNMPSQKMQKNVGYKLHQCNDIKDLLYYTVV
jgi:hypothetical protein